MKSARRRGGVLLGVRSIFSTRRDTQSGTAVFQPVDGFVDIFFNRRTHRQNVSVKVFHLFLKMKTHLCPAYLRGGYSLLVDDGVLSKCNTLRIKTLL